MKQIIHGFPPHIIEISGVIGLAEGTIAFVDQLTNWLISIHTVLTITVLIAWVILLYLNRIIDRYSLHVQLEKIKENKTAVDAMYRDAAKEADNAHLALNNIQQSNNILLQSIGELTSSMSPTEQQAVFEGIKTRLQIQEATHDQKL